MLFSGIGSMTTEAATSTQITQEASKYIGVKYVYGGTTVNGFDCSGYTQYVYKQLGLSIPRTSLSQWETGTAISKANLNVGDLVFFNTTGRVASHVGIYIGNDQFIHAGSSTGVTIASMNSSYWAPKFDGGRRVADISASQLGEVKSAEIDFTVYASRGEVALKLATELGLNVSDKNSPFPDVPSNSKYAGAVTALYKLGVFTGDNNGRFNPNAPLTREQMAKILVETFDLKSKGVKYNFTDVQSNAWSYNYIQNLASNEVTYGIGNNKYGPDRNVMFTELDLFIDRASKK